MPQLKKFLKGFIFAGNGIRLSFHERNVRVHLIAALITICAGYILSISATEWVIIIFLIAAVISAEMFNTVVENVCNCMRDTLGIAYEGTTAARDMSAGAVLVLAIAAVMIGAIIFIPKIWFLFAPV